MARSRFVLFAVALFAAAPPPAEGCFLDLLGICGGAKSIAKSLEDLPDKVREAAEDVLDQLFNKDLPPAVDKITAAAEQMLDRGEQDYEKAVNATRDALTELAKTVVHQCEELAKDITKDVEEIVGIVMKDAVQAVGKIVADVDQRVNALISRLEVVGQTVFCAATGYLDTLEKQFSSYFEKKDCNCVQAMLQDNPGLKQDCECSSCLHIGGFYPSCGCNPWGLKFGPGWYNRGKYQFAKCHLTTPIDYERWTVQQIMSQLSIVQEMALSFRCLEDMQPGSTLNRDYFSNEFTNISHQVLVLENAGVRSTREALPATREPSRAQRTPAAQGGVCDDKTVPECIVEALAEIKTAEQDMKDQKEEFIEAKKILIAAQANLSAAQANLSAAQANLAATVFANNEKLAADISAKSADISANSKSIASIQSKVSGLSIGLCNCQGVDFDDPVPDGFVVADFTAYCETCGGEAPAGQIVACQPCLQGDDSFAKMTKKKKSSYDAHSKTSSELEVSV